MAAFSQIHVGLGSSGEIVNKQAFKWYPLSNKEVATGFTSSVRFVNGKFWAFTAGHSVKQSYDGKDWVTAWPGYALEQVSAGIGQPALNDIATNGSVSVIVGGLLGGTAVIISSTDGENWTRRATTVATPLLSVAWSPVLNLFLAVGSSGYTAFSYDGENWSAGLRAGTTDLNKVEWGGSNFGITSTSGNTIYRSTNGTSFTGVTPAAFAVTDICYSPELNLWAVSRITGAGTVVMTSPDLIVWTGRAITNLSNAYSAYGVVWDGQRFMVSTNGGGVATSTNGVAWALANGRVSQNGRMAAMSPTLTVTNAYASGGLAFTEDGGYNWGASINEQMPPIGYIRSNEGMALVSCTYVAGRYWALSSTNAGVWWSIDLKHWFASPIPLILPQAVAGTMTAVESAPAATNPYLTIVGITSTSVGQILTSLDNGLTWVVRASGSTGTGFLCVASNGVTTVACSNNGVIMSTTDGVTWTSRTSGTTSPIRSVIYADGKFVAVGTSYAAYSFDGVTWVNVSASFGTLAGYAVVYNGVQYIAAGTGTASVNTKVSSDGVTWTTGPVAPWGATTITSMAWTGVNLVALVSGSAVMVMYVGSTLANISAVPLPGQFATNGRACMAVNNNTLVIAGTSSSYFLRSNNHGASWATTNAAEPVYTTSVTEVRNPLILFEGKLHHFSQSTSGLPFIARYIPEDDTYEKIPAPSGAFTPSALIKAGSNYVLATGSLTTTGRIYTSPDMRAWTLRASPAAQVRALAHAGNIIVAALNTGSTSSSVTLIRSPDDGGTWVNMSGGAGFNASRIAVDGNGWFTAVGRNGANGSIWKCYDGVTWTNYYNSATENFTDIVYANGVYIATSMGTGSKIFTSPNGENWTAVGPTSYQQLYCICYSPTAGAFFAGGANGAMYKSTDNGATWTGVTVAATAIYGLVYDNVSAVYAMTQRGSILRFATS